MRLRNPLRVWFYRGAWRWSCRYGKWSSEILPCAVGRRAWDSPGKAADAARWHLGAYHVPNYNPVGGPLE